MRGLSARFPYTVDALSKRVWAYPITGRSYPPVPLPARLHRINSGLPDQLRMELKTSVWVSAVRLT